MRWIIRKSPTDVTAYDLYNEARHITEVFLPTEEEAEEDFADGTKYTYVADILAVENETDYPDVKEFFLTPEGSEAVLREIER